MPSSTSNSDLRGGVEAIAGNRSGRAWITLWVVVALIAILALASIEWLWRSQGYVPTVIDSKALWSVQRDRVDRVSHPLVLIGASRTEYGIDMEVLQQEMPGYTPIMLAINGHYPLAVLRDLAADEKFGGMVWVDIDSDGLRKIMWDNASPWVEYYHHQWSPSMKVHRQILTRWQAMAVIANPRFGALATLEDLVKGSRPHLPPLTYHADRSGDIDYSKTDAAAIRRHFEKRAKRVIKTVKFPDPQHWFQNLSTVNAWVRAIQARGGTVIFYQTVAHGVIRTLGDKVFPRALFWDRFAATTPAHALMLRDIPAIEKIKLPDGSHVDMRDKALNTRAMIAAFAERGWISPNLATQPPEETPGPDS